MRHWSIELIEQLRSEGACVRIVVAEVAGSAPCATGTSMLVSDTRIWGTIGGGRLEFQAIARAREMLQHPRAPAHSEKILLGTKIQQCCGGQVTLWWERYSQDDLERVSEFSTLIQERGYVLLKSSTHQPMTRVSPTDGAAPQHPASKTRPQRLASEASPQHPASKTSTSDPILRRLTTIASTHEATPHRSATTTKPDGDKHHPDHPTASTTIAADEAGNPLLFETTTWTPEELWLFGAGHVGKAIVHTLENLPFRIFWVDNRREHLPPVHSSQVSTVLTETPEEAVERASPESWFLVMTHDHAIDFRVVRAVLSRADVRFLGLIGSLPKAKRFRNQLHALGVSQDRIQRLICPIGLPGLTSKNPQAIAVSTVAQLLLEMQSPRTSSPT